MATHIKVSAECVIAACDRYLAARAARDNAEREALIEKAMRRRWWRRGLTREAAIESLQNGSDEFMSDWERVEWIGGAWVETVRQLRKLARLAQAEKVPVMIDADDVALLDEHWGGDW